MRFLQNGGSQGKGLGALEKPYRTIGFRRLKLDIMVGK